MPKRKASGNNRRAGQNIRALATRRRIKAITSFISAGLVILLPPVLFRIFEQFVKQLSTLGSAQTQAPTIQVPIYLYLCFVVIALGLIYNGMYLWKRANHADQGAQGEEDIAAELAPLVQAGWQIEYGMLLRGLGDADLVCISPQNRAYVIDVKSHRGEVTTDGQQLYRRIKNANSCFEKDFLSQAMKQALQVKKQMKLNFVTPIVAFSNAKVSVPGKKLRGVYVVEKQRLVSLLNSLG